MKAFLYLLYGNGAAALVIGGSIFLFWGKDGGALAKFVAWWCGLLGVVDPLSIQVSIGIVAGALLLAPIWWVWVLIAEGTIAIMADAETKRLRELAWQTRVKKDASK
jgi:hypothetical protein